MKSVFLLSCLMLCVSFVSAQKTLTTYQEPVVNIQPQMPQVALTEPSWTYPISNSNNTQVPTCICAEIHNNTILFNNNGFITLLDIESGHVLWQYETPILDRFISNNQSILILDSNGFKVLDLANGKVLNEIPIAAQSRLRMNDSTYNGDFIFDYSFKDNIIYISIGSVETKWTLSALDSTTGEYLWKHESFLTHQFREIVSDVIISFAHQPLTTGRIYSFISTKTGEQLWSAAASTRMAGASIINIDDSSIDLFQLRGVSAESIGDISKHNLTTGEKLGHVRDFNFGCGFQSPIDWESPNGEPSINYILDASTFVQDDNYMYIQSKPSYGNPKIYRQKRCDRQDFNPDQDKSVMFLSYSNQKEWIAGPIEGTFLFTDSNGLSGVQTIVGDVDHLRPNSSLVVNEPIKGYFTNLFGFRHYLGIESEVNHLRIYKNIILTGSKDGMFQASYILNYQPILKANLGTSLVQESYLLDNGILAITGGKIAYIEFKE